MATVKQSLIENDVVMLRERVGDWPAGTIGTAVSIHEESASALVEVSDSTTGVGLDMFVVPADLLEIQPRSWLKP